MGRRKKTSSALALLLAGLAFAGCGSVDKQESVSVNLETFTSPDGNIGCIADETMVRCDIRHKEWKVKKDPSCQLDYGNGLTVADGKASLTCAGDTTLSDGPKLGTGMINMVGPFECMTNDWGDGMRCENVLTGNGFELSAEDYETF
jgi:hypothetical protein